MKSLSEFCIYNFHNFEYYATKTVENNIAINHSNVFHLKQVQLHTIQMKLVLYLDAKGLKLSLIYKGQHEKGKKRGKEKRIQNSKSKIGRLKDKVFFIMKNHVCIALY